MSVSIGEEDRQSLTDVMRVMFRRYIPLMCVICVGIILCAEPITRLFFRDPAEPVCMMTVWGLRLLPLSMPLSIMYMHFVGYGQASGKCARPVADRRRCLRGGPHGAAHPCRGHEQRVPSRSLCRASVCGGGSTTAGPISPDSRWRRWRATSSGTGSGRIKKTTRFERTAFPRLCAR